MENARFIPENTQTVANELADKSETLAAACLAMKQENITEGQKIIANPQAMGKPQTFAAVCEDMKDQIEDEAKQVIESSTPGINQQ